MILGLGVSLVTRSIFFGGRLVAILNLGFVCINSISGASRMYAFVFMTIRGGWNSNTGTVHSIQLGLLSLSRLIASRLAILGSSGALMSREINFCFIPLVLSSLTGWSLPI